MKKSSHDIRNEGIEELDSDIVHHREVSNEEGGASDCFFDIDKMLKHQLIERGRTHCLKRTSF